MRLIPEATTKRGLFRPRLSLSSKLHRLYASGPETRQFRAKSLASASSATSARAAERAARKIVLVLRARSVLTQTIEPATGYVGATSEVIGTFKTYTKPVLS